MKIPLVLRVGIWFGIGASPREFMEDLLSDAGCQTPEELRDLFDHPPRRLMARPAPGHFSPKDVRLEKPEVILREAIKREFWIIPSHESTLDAFKSRAQAIIDAMPAGMIAG